MPTPYNLPPEIDDLIGSADLAEFRQKLATFPVGSVYLNLSGINPTTELGYGTWLAFGAGRTLIGFDAGDSDYNAAEATGGAKTVAAAGSVTAPTITGNTGDEAGHTHSVTSNVSIADHTFTQPTISWPAGVPTISGIVISDHASHTHTYTQVPNHVHIQRMHGGTTSNASGTNIMGSNATGGSLRSSGQSTLDPTDGVASATTNGPSATLSHSLASQGSIAWPAGVPAATGGAVNAHSVTNNAVASGAGSAHSHGAGSLTASAPAFTGAATSVVQPFIVVHFWKRTA